MPTSIDSSKPCKKKVPRPQKNRKTNCNSVLQRSKPLGGGNKHQFCSQDKSDKPIELFHTILANHISLTDLNTPRQTSVTLAL